MFLWKRRSCEYRHCRCLARIAVALIALNCRSVFGHIQSTTLPAKQAITVGSSSGLNVKLLHDWSNFDLPKLMPVEHIFLMPSSCLSLTLIHARIHANKLLITAQPIRNLLTPASAEITIAGVPYPLSPIPIPFLLHPYPLPLSTPVTRATQ